MSSSEVLNKGIVRATTVPTFVDTQEGTFQLNPRGENISVTGLPERVELNRLGAGVIIRTAAAVTLNQALPTTTASHYIWNGEGSNGKSYIVDRIRWNCTTTSAGAAASFQMFACLGKQSVSQPATTDTLVTASMNGKKYGGRAGMGHAATVVDDTWVPIGACVNSAALTATKGNVGCDAVINGDIIIPPGCLLSLDVVATNATASGQFYVTIYEVQLVNTLS